MKIEKERNSIKITYSACASVDRITELYDAIASRIAGIYLPSDIQNGKEGITLNIRHRESLQMYFEKNIFRIDDYIEVLRRLKEIIKALRANGFEPGNCVWDVDAVFVGGSFSELELVYLAEPEASEADNNTLTDFLAVMSLHVFDSRDSAIEALSDAVGEFASVESSAGSSFAGEAQFERAINILNSFSSGAGRVRRIIYCLWSRIKKAVRGSLQKEPRQENDHDVGADVPAAGLTEFVNKKLPLSDDARGPYFEHEDAEIAGDPGTRGSAGLESRLIKVETDDYRPYVIDTTVQNRFGVIYPIGREFLLKRAGIDCPYVSRRHAEIMKKGGEFVISDLGSLNGTYLNGSRLMPGAYYRVVKGDVISLAHVSMSFRFCT